MSEMVRLGNQDDMRGGSGPLFEGYEKYLADQLSSSRTDFNTAINWAIVSFGGGMIILARPADLGTWSIALVLILIVSHFATRAARGYVNIIRWALILQRVTKYQVTKSHGICGAELDTLRNEAEMGIAIYHVDWASPIGRISLVTKILFEFGFGYLFAILFVYLAAVAMSPLASEFWEISAIATALVAWEWFSFLRSHYLHWIILAKETPFLVYGRFPKSEERFSVWLERQKHLGSQSA